MISHVLLSTLIFFSAAISMEAPPRAPQPKKRIGQAVPSLTDIALEPIAKKINSLEDFKRETAKIPRDRHCDVVKLIIKRATPAIKLTHGELLTLINDYCSGDLALIAYMAYKKHPMAANSFMESIENKAKERGDQRGYDVAWCIAESEGHYPLGEALRHKKMAAAEFFMAMGEKPRVQDLVNAIVAHDTHMVELLINSGAPVEDPQGIVNVQPLLYALGALNAPDGNEKIIELLINAGASITKPYLLTRTLAHNASRSIAEQQRLFIQPWLSQPVEERVVPAGETVDSLERKYRKMLALVEKYEALEKQKGAQAKK